MGRQLPPAAVADRIGFATQTLANWRNIGTGPAFYKIGRLVRYDEDILDAWLTQQRTTSE